tara:strand:+ start:477 stop:1517 length:1041 start_codon:yes stop_codon:yes gene_type:complete
MENWRRFLNEEQEAPQAAPGGTPAAKWIVDNIAPLLGAAKGDSTADLITLVNRLNSTTGTSEEVRALLAAGAADGDANDEVISVKMGLPVSAPNLYPTQGVIDLHKSVGYNGSLPEGLKKVIAGGPPDAPPILVAGQEPKYYIIDGHHRWSGAAVFNPEVEIICNVIDVPADKALMIAQIAIAGWQGGGKKLPSLGAKKGRSIIGPNAMAPAAVYKNLKSNIGVVIDKWAGQPFWNPRVLQVVKQSGYGSDMPAAGIPMPPEEKAPQQDLQEFNQMEMEMVSDRGLKKIAANCGILAKKHALKGPPREYMPQFEPKAAGPDFEDVEDAFTGGKINYKPSFDIAAEE